MVSGIANDSARLIRRRTSTSTTTVVRNDWLRVARIGCTQQLYRVLKRLHVNVSREVIAWITYDVRSVVAKQIITTGDQKRVVRRWRSQARRIVTD